MKSELSSIWIQNWAAAAAAADRENKAAKAAETEMTQCEPQGPSLGILNCKLFMHANTNKKLMFIVSTNRFAVICVKNAFKTATK